MNKFEVLEQNLNDLVGQKCWSVLISSGLDNSVTISMGDKIIRSKPLDAPNLTGDQKHFIGNYELVIADCTWRLDSPNSIVTSWSDEDDAKREAMKYLVGESITAWDITWPGLDLTLHFEHTLSLRLFCDQTDPTDSGENYALLVPDYLFNVGVRSELSLYERPKA